MRDTRTTHKRPADTHTTHENSAAVNAVTFKIICRKEATNAAGVAPLSIKAFVNGEKTVIPLSQMVKPENWDHKNQCIKPQEQNAIEKNQIVAEARTRAMRVHANANMANIRLTREIFGNMFRQTFNNEDFIQYAINELNKRKGNIEPGTFRAQQSVLKKLNEYRLKIEFSDLTPMLLEDFDKWMKVKRSNDINTRHNALKTIKTYVNRALRAGYVFNNPFLKFKLRKGETQRTFLTDTELEQLLKIYDEKTLPEKLQVTLLFFLISCFTSLRMSDVRALNSEMIQQNKLTFIPRKTKGIKKQVSVPIKKTAGRLLKAGIKYRGRLKAEQKMNEDLKVIAQLSNIEKRITFHVARHTFATVYLELGGTIQGLKELLGHTSINTTMIYTHLIDKRLDIEMSNFDKRFR